MKLFSVSPSHLRRGSLLALGVLWGALQALPGFAQGTAPAAPSALPATPTPQKSALNNGSPEEASKYYKELSAKLGILTPATIEAKATVKDLVSYLGYKELTPEDIEFATPESLMGGTATPAQTQGGAVSGEILVSRFFAPKIVDFSVAPAQRKVGWRRLVRMKARAGSQAQKHFVESAWILFNHFTAPPAHSPFGGTNVPLSAKNGSVNTQVALLTQCKAGQTACQNAELNSIYWMDFGRSENGYKLSYQLDAFFDAGSLHSTAAPYFVPNGCDTCHGSLRGKAVLNHLDTDHWLDRLKDGDFPAMNKADAPAALFDAGKNVQSPRYTAAFDVLRQLNQEVAAMQKRVAPNGVHHAATNKWLEIHKTSAAPETDLIKRAFSFSNTGHPLQKGRKPTAAPLSWTSSAEDKELLGLMNKYCYRCHGAVRYNIFSKDMVADQSSPILDRLDPNPTQAKIVGFKMPVDRDMSEQDRKRLIELIGKLYTQTH